MSNAREAKIAASHYDTSTAQRKSVTLFALLPATRRRDRILAPGQQHFYLVLRTT